LLANDVLDRSGASFFDAKISTVEGFAGMSGRSLRLIAGTTLVEAHYRFNLTDNILLTPGAYVVFNPEHDDDNDEIYVAILRATFSF
jgi:carbohydrate-selective porin OprB